MNCDLYFKTTGKWILVGEHSVLRGFEAIVFPLKSHYLEFKYYQNTDKNFEVNVTGKSASDVELIIWSTFERIFKASAIDRSKVQGRLDIHSEIYFGAGTGASAALSVGLARFFKYLNLLNEDLYTFSKKIEDLFHGESSGLDVAVVLNQTPLFFKKNSLPVIIENYKKPIMFLSHTGLKGVTKDCVSKVKALIEGDSEKGLAVDLKMQESSSLMKQLLLSKEGPIDLQKWIKAFNLAESCFYDWGLVPSEVQNHMDELKQQGAVATKLTGSGGGGYVISLWDENHLPSGEVINKYNLISV